jgi:histone-lysine N-methyltransferase SETMAR
MVCKHTGSPKPKKFKQTFHGRKLMATVFWDSKGVLLVAFMNPGATIISKVHCEILKQLSRGIRDRQHSLLTMAVMLLHANMRPLTAVHTVQFIRQFKCELFYHPPFSPDMTPNDYHLFLHLKTFLEGEMLKSMVENWLDI